VRKEWIAEALDKMIDLGLIEKDQEGDDVFLVELPPRTHRSLDEWICERLSDLDEGRKKESRVAKVRKVRQRPISGARRLTQYFC